MYLAYLLTYLLFRLSSGLTYALFTPNKLQTISLLVGKSGIEIHSIRLVRNSHGLLN